MFGLFFGAYILLPMIGPNGINSMILNTNARCSSFIEKRAKAEVRSSVIENRPRPRVSFSFEAVKKRKKRPGQLDDGGLADLCIIAKAYRHPELYSLRC